MYHLMIVLSRRVLIAAVLFASGLGQRETFGQAKAVLEILPSVDSVAPGESFQVALKFKLQEGWHLYWANPGDSGLPPQIKWSVPEGFKVGELQFPTPTLHTAPGNLVTNTLPGEPVLLADVTAPARLPSDGKLTFTADASWLVCKELCVREKQTVALMLPPAGTEGAKPTNGDVFARAQASMPVKQSQHVTIQPSSTKERVRAGESFEVVLQVSIAEGLSLPPSQSSAVGAPGTNVFVKPAPGLAFEHPIFPPPATVPSVGGGTSQGYTGRVFIRIPAKVESGAATAPIPIGGILVFQAQTGTGDQILPVALEWELKVDLAK